MFAGGIAPKYVLDEMEPYEIEIALEGLHRKNQEAWEQTRQVVYSIVQVNSKNNISPTDLMPFPWDKEEEEDCSKTSSEDSERLTELMSQIVKEKNNASGFSSKTAFKE